MPFSLTGLQSIQAVVQAESRLSGRAIEAVRLLAVSKTQPQTEVLAAISAGQFLFGENRVQEAAAKFAGLRGRFPDLELHLIGPLQTNKVREAVALFDVIQTVDRPKLAEVLAIETSRNPGRLQACLIEINIGEEPQKAGVLPSQADAFIRDCRDRLGLPIAGVMGIPPFGEEPSPYFALLREIAKRHHLTEISMGMSADFRLAIQQGATLVRVGSALFGERDRPVV